jgi:hypothetical protein
VLWQYRMLERWRDAHGGLGVLSVSLNSTFVQAPQLVAALDTVSGRRLSLGGVRGLGERC